MFLVPTIIQSQEMIVNTYNYYTWNPNLSDINVYEEINSESKGDNWAKVRNGMTQEQAIISAARFEVFDYNLFDYFEKYREYVPLERQEIIKKEVPQNWEDLDPKLVLEFILHLEQYLNLNFPKDDYYYAIFDKVLQDVNLNPARVFIDEFIHNISTIHTTYTKEEFIENLEEHRKYKDAVQIRKENGSSRSEWEISWKPISNNSELVTDKKTLIFKRTTHKAIAEQRLEQLKKLCKIAIQLNLKIKRNTDWFG